MTDQTQKIDILETAIAVNGGEPQAVTLAGHEFNVRRDYTGDDVTAYIQCFTPEAFQRPAEEQIHTQLAALTDLAGDALNEVTEFLLTKPSLVVNPVLIRLGEVAGLRKSDGSFTVGQQPS